MTERVVGGFVLRKRHIVVFCCMVFCFLCCGMNVLASESGGLYVTTIDEDTGGLKGSIMVGVDDSRMLPDGSYSSEAAVAVCDLINGELLVCGNGECEIQIAIQSENDLDGICDIVRSCSVQDIAYAMPLLNATISEPDGEIGVDADVSSVSDISNTWQNEINLYEARAMMGKTVGANMEVIDNAFDYDNPDLAYVDYVGDGYRERTMKIVEDDWVSAYSKYLDYHIGNGVEPEYPEDPGRYTSAGYYLGGYMQTLPDVYRTNLSARRGCHGTHVAGIAGGAHSRRIDGAVPKGTKVVTHDINHFGLNHVKFMGVTAGISNVMNERVKVLSCSVGVNVDGCTSEEAAKILDKSRAAVCSQMIRFLDFKRDGDNYKYDFIAVQAAGNDGNDVSMQNGLFSGITRDNVEEGLRNLWKPVGSPAITDEDIDYWYHALRSRIIIVGNADYDDLFSDSYKLVDDSCYGPDVDICAPGQNVVSTGVDGHYISMSGTSMATPMVAGVASMVWGMHPDFCGIDRSVCSVHGIP